MRLAAAEDPHIQRRARGREGGRKRGRQRGGCVHRQRKMPSQTYVAVRRHLARERSGVFVFWPIVGSENEFLG